MPYLFNSAYNNSLTKKVHIKLEPFPQTTASTSNEDDLTDANVQTYSLIFIKIHIPIILQIQIEAIFDDIGKVVNRKKMTLKRMA